MYFVQSNPEWLNGKERVKKSEPAIGLNVLHLEWNFIIVYSKALFVMQLDISLLRDHCWAACFNQQWHKY